ncbi:MAG: NAD(P)H-hydrate dehydratase [Candidatus Nanohaloarchaea archaeon]|nr:NAD(P)H-hydrate dehydratase [Candidatus Nanohaloarchaea archaeon]
MRRIEELFRPRPEDSRKGDFGKIAFVGGSYKFPNTPAIAALASARTGSDLEIILAPERSADLSASFAPDMISRRLEGKFLGPENVDEVIDTVESCDCLVIGNGLGDSKETLEAVEQIIEGTQAPAVLDADALKADIRSMDLEGRKSVLTPHRKEFERLYGEEPAEKLGAVKEQVKKASRVFNSTIVLKSPVDVVSDGSTTLTNDSGNPYMTRGGTGDILAGVCGAIFSRASALDAGIASARITGNSGDIAAEELSQSLTVEDVIGAIPEAIENLS